MDCQSPISPFLKCPSSVGFQTTFTCNPEAIGHRISRCRAPHSLPQSLWKFTPVQATQKQPPHDKSSVDNSLFVM